MKTVPTTANPRGCFTGLKEKNFSSCVNLEPKKSVSTQKNLVVLETNKKKYLW